MQFETVIQYREQDPDKPVIDLDSKQLIIACIASGVLPLRAVSNGSKSKVLFYADEAQAAIQAVQLYLSNCQSQLTVDYIKVLKAEALWSGLMSLQGNIKQNNSGN